MLIPILSGACGACLFMALGFAFAEVINIPASTRTPLVLVASFTVAFGATFGSVGSGIEIFRKSYKGAAKTWDWISLVISTCTTVAGFAMGFAALLGATATWSAIAVIYGSLVVGTLAALDSSGDMIELGGLFGSFEDRYERWLAEREEWREANGQTVVGDSERLEKEIAQLVRKVAELDQRWTWPVANKGQFEAIVAGMNGERASLDRKSALLLLAENQLAPPSASTLARWIKVAKENDYE
jgi:hypothetical protein